MKTVKIRWQRLVYDSGETCDRCQLTEKEVKKASSTLKQALITLGMDVILEKAGIDYNTFVKDPLMSNRIWINDKPLEEWLKAKVGQSFRLCEPCGEEECRTITIESRTYETIPADLIIEGGLRAASQLLDEG